MMASGLHNTLFIKVNYKRILGLVLICFLFLISVNPTYLFSTSFITGTKGEFGAPPLNGTTIDIWYIGTGETINRNHENIVTQNISLNASSVMNWENVSADINGEVNIKSGATFNLTDCNLVLSGNLSIYGNLNMINSTILVNCSTMGEFFISVEKIGLQLGGSLRLTEGSIIAGPSNNLRIRVLWVDPVSRLYAKNSTFRYIGWVPNYEGILIEANDTIIRNSTFSHCYPGVIFSGGSRGMIENSEFSNSQVGLNFSNSTNNMVRNCTFRANNIGIYGEKTSQNIFTGAKIMENTGHGLYLDSMSYYNDILNGIIENNNWSGVVFENSSTNNNISYCIIQNNNETGIICNNKSNEILITNTTLENNEYGLKCENNSKEIKIINSTVQISSSTDFYLAHTSELISLNTSFDRNNIQVDSDSNLTVQWYLHVRTLNSTLVPIANVPVTLWDNENGSAEKNFTTDDSGWKRWIVCTEFYETGTERINLTPHTLRAHKFGYSINITNVSINSSQIQNITMNRTIPFLADLVPVKLTFSNPYPRYNQTLTILTEIKNNGLEGFDNNSTNVTVDVYVDSTLINITTNISSIPPDESIEVAVQWTVNVTNGSHIIFVYIDIDDNLTELNNTNNSISQELIVNSVPIAILSVEPNQSLTYESIQFNASESYNEVTEIEIQSYFYDFGDGTNSGWIPDAIIYHNYTDNGKYFVRVQVRDLSFQISKWSMIQELEILNRVPVANFTVEPLTGTVKTEFIFSPELSEDLDGNIIGYYWELSDGTNSTNHTLSYFFDDDIEFTISLLVFDDDGSQSERVERNITIGNLPPLATFEFSPQRPNAPEAILFDATNTTDPDDEPNTLNYTWDFDDGTFGYGLSIISHNFSEPGVYNVTLYVRDDDGESGTFVSMIEVNKTITKPSNGSGDVDVFWAVSLVVLVLIIFAVLIMLVFITQSRKLRKQLYKEQTLDSGADEFTTAGKLDFVILKKAPGKRYVKFELHSTTKSSEEYLGVIWKSALLNSSWVPDEKILDSKDKVVDYLELKILAYNSKGWAIDYGGNGTILKTQGTQDITPVPIKSLGLDQTLDSDKDEAMPEQKESDDETDEI